MEIRNTILMVFAVMSLPMSATAQFYTITEETDIHPSPVQNDTLNVGKSLKERTESVKMNDEGIKVVPKSIQVEKTSHDQKGDKRVYLRGKDKTVRKDELAELNTILPELTIQNLYREIIRNGIKHPKIVLAQAILETGWFRSKTCRQRHNLFGLTNPRTGKYYEFSHWTESVRAYYTKVHYRFKGGNYLLWLRDIGYAEDNNYIRSVISVLRML